VIVEPRRASRKTSAFRASARAMAALAVAAAAAAAVSWTAASE